jgi:hypothetical protein
MIAGSLYRPLSAAILGIATAAAASGQTTIDVNGASRTGSLATGWTYGTWKPIFAKWDNPNASSEGYLLDPIYDQQTGQGDSDFVSSSNANGTANPGFLIQFGTINGVEHIAFRIMLNEYKTTGNLVNIRFGFDGNYDGRLDLYMGLSQQNGQTGLVFQAPGSGLLTENVSPSTSSYGNPFYPTANRTGLPALNAQNNALLLTSSNFSNIAIGDGVHQDRQGGQGTVLADNRATYYPGWQTQYEDATVDQNSPIYLDSMISYAFPLADINAALVQTGFVGSSYTVTADRLMLWAAVTATQNNSVNQDAYGTDTAGFTSRYDSFLGYTSPNGNPVPEPGSYGLALGVGLGGLLFLRRRRQSRALAA